MPFPADPQRAVPDASSRPPYHWTKHLTPTRRRSDTPPYYSTPELLVPNAEDDDARFVLLQRRPPPAPRAHPMAFARARQKAVRKTGGTKAGTEADEKLEGGERMRRRAVIRCLERRAKVALGIEDGDEDVICWTGAKGNEIVLR